MQSSITFIYLFALLQGIACLCVRKKMFHFATETKKLKIKCNNKRGIKNFELCHRHTAVKGDRSSVQGKVFSLSFCLFSSAVLTSFETLIGSVQCYFQ